MIHIYDLVTAPKSHLPSNPTLEAPVAAILFYEKGWCNKHPNIKNI